MSNIKLNESEKYRIFRAKRVQLTCPNCKYEFPSSDTHELDIKSKRLKKKRQAMKNELSRYEKYGKFKDYQDENWVEKTRKGIIKATEKIAEYEAIRKQSNQRKDEIKYFTLKELIKEKYGKEEFIILMDECERRVKSYQLEEIMQVKNYTHSSGGSLSKIS